MIRGSDSPWLHVQGLTEQKGKAVICDSEVPGTLIVTFTPAMPKGALGSNPAKPETGLGPKQPAQLSLRVDTLYPQSTPVYFRHIVPDQTLPEQTQVLAPYLQPEDSATCCASMTALSFVPTAISFLMIPHMTTCVVSRLKKDLLSCRLLRCRIASMQQS